MFYLESELFEYLRTENHAFGFINDEVLDGLWFWDLDEPENEYLSPGFWKTLGFNHQEMPHKSSAWQELINPDDAALAQKLIAEHLENPHRPYRQILRYQTKTGNTLYIRCIGKLVMLPNGGRRMIGMHLDVTKEQEVRRELQDFFDYSQELILIASLEGEILRTNRLWDEFVENRQQDLAGKELFKALTKYFKRETIKKLKDSLADGSDISLLQAKLNNLSGETNSFDLNLVQTNRYLLFYAYNTSLENKLRVELDRSSSLLKLLLEVTDQFYHLDLKDLDKVLNQSLARLGTKVNADRCYIFKYDFTNQTSSNTHEWCAPGVSAQIDYLQEVPMEETPDFIDTHLKGEDLWIQDVQELPEGSLKEILASQEIRSLLSVPIYHHGECLGMVGFDWLNTLSKNTREEQRILRIFGSSVGQMLGNLKLSRLKHEENLVNQAIINYSQLAISINDPKSGAILAVNQAFCELVRYPENQLVGTNPPFIYWPQNQVEELSKVMQEALESSQNAFNLNFQNKKGEIIPVNVSTYQVLGDTADDILRVIATFEDLRPQKKLEQKLAFERKKNQNLVQKSLLFFINLSAQGKVLSLNQAAAEIFDLKTKKFPATFFVQYLKKHQADFSLTQEVEQNARSIQSVVLPFPTKYGKEGLIEWTFHPSGEEVLAYGQDVSEREKLAQSLRQNEEQLKEAELLGAMGSMVYLPEAKQYSLSPGFKTLFKTNLNLNEPFQSLLKHLLNPKDLPRAKKAWHTALEDRQSEKIGLWYKFGKQKQFIEWEFINKHSSSQEQELHAIAIDRTQDQRQKEDLQNYQNVLEYRNRLMKNLLSLGEFLTNLQVPQQEVLEKVFAGLTKLLDPKEALYLHLGQLVQTEEFELELLAAKPKQKRRKQQRPIPSELQTRFLRKNEPLIFLKPNEPLELIKGFSKHGWEERPKLLFPLRFDDGRTGLFAFSLLDHTFSDSFSVNALSNLAIEINRYLESKRIYVQTLEGKKRFETIAETTRAAFFEIDLIQNSLLRGPGFESTFQYPMGSSPFDKEDFLDKVHPKQRADVTLALNSLIAGSTNRWSGSCLLRLSSGTYRRVEAIMAVSRNEQGQVGKIFGSLSDKSFTNDEKSLFQSAAEIVELAAWEWDFKSNSFFTTPNLLSILGLPSDHQIDIYQEPPKYKIEIYHNNQWILLRELLKSLTKSNQNVFKVTREIRLHDGRLKWIAINAFRYVDSKNNTIGFNGVIQDISDQKESELKLAESNRWLEKAQEVGQLGYFIIDFQKNSWKVSSVLAKLFELDQEEHYSTDSWLELVHPKDRERVLAHFQNSVQNKTPYKIQFLTFPKKTNNSFWIDCSAETSYDENGEPVLMLGTAINIDDSIKSLEKLEKQNNRLREIAWSQSHLVRAPISRIQGMLSEIEDQNLEANEQKQFIKYIKSSVEELDLIVKDLIKKANVIEENNQNPNEVDSSKSLIIHLVDDDQLILKLHEKQLKRFGLGENLKLAKSGRAFVRNLEEAKDDNTVHLILLDINMPDFDGWDVLDYLGKTEGTNNVMVVVVSSSTDTADLRKSYQYDHVIDYQEKPLTQDKLSKLFGKQRLRSIIEKERKKNQKNP